MKYCLMTFVNRGSEENPIWEVYGHVKEFNNDHIDTFKTRIEAVEHAHQFGVPVMQGFSNSIGVTPAIRKLAAV